MFSELPCILCFLGYDAIANSAGRSEKSAEKYAYWYYRVAYNSYGALYDSNAQLTGTVKYFEYEGVAAPVAYALNEGRHKMGIGTCSVGAIAGLTPECWCFWEANPDDLFNGKGRTHTCWIFQSG